MPRQFVLAVLYLLSLPSVARPEPPAGKSVDSRETIRKGLTYVETKSLAWLRDRKCASCHHVPMMVWTQREARQRGFQVDENSLQEATAFLLADDNRANIVPNPGDPEREGNGYSLLALQTILAFRDVGQGAEPAADEVTKKALAHLLSTQQADGSWKPFLGRPPIFNLEELSTLLVAFGLGTNPSASREAEPDRTKMRQWLEVNAKDENPQALSLRILIDQERSTSVGMLLKRQNADGGWSQTAEMASDAFATGQAIYALVSHGGIEASDPSILRARDFLTSTQQADGSWPMTSRPPNSGEGTEGAGNLEPISVAGSAWAVLGLLQLETP